MSERPRFPLFDSLRAIACVLRIVPAHWVALTLITLWLGLQSQVFSADGVALAASLGIAAASWYVVERPSLRPGRRLTGPTAQTRTLADDRAAVAAEARPS
jgi:peptidoglycan/LPS O-acetylase OafA/YrhL